VSALKQIAMLVVLAGILLVSCAAPVERSDTAGEATEAQLVRTMTVYKSPTCGCCSDWIAYVEEHGYDVTVEDVADLNPIKAEYAVPPAMQSCHTAIIDGYVVEGHVPVEDIERLLTERPAVIGIAVPGMPVGSPGMEVPGAEPRPYDVVSFDANGVVEVVARYHQ
jgi:hypothetical protein